MANSLDQSRPKGVECGTFHPLGQIQFAPDRAHYQINICVKILCSIPSSESANHHSPLFAALNFNLLLTFATP
jgi:hypothetical protein